MNLHRIERQVVVSTRFFTLIAVFGSLAGSVLMFGSRGAGMERYRGPDGSEEPYGAEYLGASRTAVGMKGARLAPGSL